MSVPTLFSGGRFKKEAKIMRRMARPLMIGFALAGAAFSYAVATSDSATATGSESKPQIGGWDLRFLCSSELGPVLLGTEVSRYLIAAGGCRPYEFFAGTMPAGWTLFPDGRVYGKSTTAGKEVFEAFVRDRIGDQIGSIVGMTFSITTVDPKDYADPVILTGELPPAVLGAPYMVQLQTAGGVISHTYSLLDSDKDNLPPGLVLTKEGLIVGKPSVIPAATLPFSVKVTDGVNRSDTKQFTIPVARGQLGGDLMLHKGRFRLDFSRVNNDRLDLIMFLNDRSLADREELEGYKFLLSFGRFQTEHLTLTKKGIYRAVNPQTKGETEIKIKPKLGRIKVKITNANLIDPLQATEAGYDDPIIPIRVALSNGDGSFSIMAIETARFDYDRTTSIGIGRFDVRDQDTPGGVFFLTKCAGRIVKDKNDRDTLRLAISGYARAPGGASAAPKTSDDVDVRVGDFRQVLPGTSFRFRGSTAVPLAAFSAPGAAGIRKLVVGGGSRKFSLVTGPILTAPPPGVTPVPVNFGFSGQLPPGVEVVIPVYVKVYPSLGGDPSFEGQASISVFRKGDALGPGK